MSGLASICLLTNPSPKWVMAIKYFALATKYDMTLYMGIGLKIGYRSWNGAVTLKMLMDFQMGHGPQMLLSLWHMDPQMGMASQRDMNHRMDMGP